MDESSAERASAGASAEPDAPLESAAGLDPYDRLSYPGFAYAATHPGRLAALGLLFGRRPARPESCRVLELGCGDGANALSIAHTLPGARVLGVDAAAGAIARGAALARAAGLSNVELRQARFEQLGEESGGLGGELEGFDYVIAHGVYSWVPPAVRGALLACVKRCLSPEGIAFVSYNAYPGSYLRDMARDILAYHVREVSQPEERLAKAQELMQAIVAIEDPSPFARVLREHMERMLRYSDALLFHDDLAEVSTPFYFHEFADSAARHGLQFLSEADLSESQLRELPESAASLIQSLPEDPLAREQYLDFFKNRMFRQTLICHDAPSVSRAIDDESVEALWISSAAKPEPQQAVEGETFVTPDGFTVTTSERLVSGAMHALAEAWPASLDFPRLLDRSLARAGLDEVGTRESPARLRGVLLEAHLARIVQLRGCPPPVPPASEPGERPRASSLARAQHAAGLPALASLLHANVRLEGELEPRLLPLLDGARNVGELASELSAPPADVLSSIQRLGSIGLLCA